MSDKKSSINIQQKIDFNSSLDNNRRIVSFNEYCDRKGIAIQINKEKEIINAFVSHAKKLDW